MRLLLISERVIIGALLGLPTILKASDNIIVASVKAMEASEGLTVITPSELRRTQNRRAENADTYVMGAPAISPDAMAITWWRQPFPRREQQGPPFLTVESVKDGRRPVRLDGYFATGNVGISSGAEIIVVTAHQSNERPTQLLALDLRSGVEVHNLTSSLTQLDLADLERISISGTGMVAALGSRDRIQVMEIPSGKTAYAGPGRFPKLSPDGKRLAFINKERLYIRSLIDGSTTEPIREIRVMGAGGWSPDGRFLLAGAWAKRLAFEKRQVIVDTKTGRYAVVGKLGEGDYGDEFAWVSIKLVAR